MPKKIEAEDRVIDGVKNLGLIAHLESQALNINFAGLEIDEVKEASQILNEVYSTEKSFLENIKALKPFMDEIKKGIKSNEDKEPFIKWDSLIEEVFHLLEKLESINSNNSQSNKLKTYQQAFSPQNLKSYLKVCTFIVPKISYDSGKNK